jgi:O-antigen/teichoic acid export membrane protein
MSDLFLAREPNLQGAKAPVRFGGVLGKCQSWLDTNRAPMRVIATLFSANVLARFVSGFSILVSVLLFSPAEFARFGMLLAALTLVCGVQFLRYETLIVAARTTAELRIVLRLTICVGLLVWLVMAAVTGAAAWLGLVGVDLALLFMSALAARGICRIANQIVIRNGGFGTLGRATLTLTCVQPTVLVMAWMLGATGTIAMGMTDVVGNIAASICLIWPSRYILREAFRRRLGEESIWSVARQRSAVPIYNLPSTLLAAAFTSVPLLVVLHFADPHVGGHVALVFRILDVPVQVIAAVISPLAMNRFHMNKGHFMSVHAPLLVGGLLLVVTSVFGGICLAALVIEPWLYGTNWAGFSVYLPQVAFFQAGIAVALPLIEIANLRSNQKTLFIIQVLAVVSISLLALAVADWQTAIMFFGWASAFRALLLAGTLLGGHAQRRTV